MHDSNILFEHRADLVLGRAELVGVIDSGLSHYSSENVPVWHWLAAFDASDRNWLQVCSVWGTTAERVGALSAMQLISDVVSSQGSFDKERCVASWFSEQTPSAVKVAALKYLAEFGTTDDLIAIKSEYDRADYSTTRAAVDAIVRIHLRDSRENAIRALYELQPESVGSDLLAVVFKNSASIGMDILSEGVEHRSSDVRRRVVKLLRQRSALDAQTAERLINDSDAVGRYEALKSLADCGRHFLDDEAKKILANPKGSPTGLFYPFPAPDNKGQACWKQFREYQFAKLTDRDLEQTCKDSSVFNRTAQFVLESRRFATMGDGLRAAVDDHFKSEFSEKLKKLTAKYGQDDDLVKSALGFEEDLRKDFTRKGLDIICQQGGAKDLGRVRKILNSGFVATSEIDIIYLGKFGEWQDIALIVHALDQPEIGLRASLLSIPDDSKIRTTARAIYSLGRHRFGELLSLPIVGRLLSYLVVESSDKIFRGLSYRAIGALLRSERVGVRKATALKCIRALPKARLRRQLDGYFSTAENRYYNVIHWLDFGISLPRDRARTAAGKLLATEWRE